jgi:hypothetical protein
LKAYCIPIAFAGCNEVGRRKRSLGGELDPEIEDTRVNIGSVGNWAEYLK